VYDAVPDESDGRQQLVGVRSRVFFQHPSPVQCFEQRDEQQISASGCCDASVKRSCALAYPATSQSRGTDVIGDWLTTGVGVTGGPAGPNGGRKGGPDGICDRR
jgi:hypothetical protein